METLDTILKTLLACVKHLGKTDTATFLRNPGQEVQA
jgi:hypothetical protein